MTKCDAILMRGGEWKLEAQACLYRRTDRYNKDMLDGTIDKIKDIEVKTH